jgi:hypothetical protein
MTEDTMATINHLNFLLYGHDDALAELREDGPLEKTKIETFDHDGSADIPHFVTQFFRKAELGLLGESKTQPVNLAAEKFRREMAAIDNRFAKMYQDIAQSESDESAEIFGRKSGDRLAKGAPLKLFVPLTKVDQEQRLVYGIATCEMTDRDNEIMDYQSSKPLFTAWSESVKKDSGGTSFGNLREMHQLSAVGTLAQIAFNDSEKRIEVCARVVDDAAWKKVLSRTYVGFSVGGKYANRWKDAATNLMRYTADPAELSLVDRPCVPNAVFQMVKAEVVGA